MTQLLGSDDSQSVVSILYKSPYNHTISPPLHHPTGQMIREIYPLEGASSSSHVRLDPLEISLTMRMHDLGLEHRCVGGWVSVCILLSLYISIILSLIFSLVNISFVPSTSTPFTQPLNPFSSHPLNPPPLLNPPHTLLSLPPFVNSLPETLARVPGLVDNSGCMSGRVIPSQVSTNYPPPPPLIAISHIYP